MATIVDTNRYNELCRLCAEKTTMLLGVHIFQNDGLLGQLRKKIETCLPIQVHEGDELPKMVCENCLYKLNMLSDFRDRTVRTERLLMDLVKATRSIQNQQCIVQMDHNDLIIHQQLLNNHGIANVDEIDLSQLAGTGREQLIQHEIILTHPNINGHSLDSIDLDHHHHHHELTEQDLPDHGLQAAQDAILVDANHHDINDGRYAGGNLDLLQHQQLLHDQFRLQQELHMADAGAEITLADGLGGATIHHKIDESLQSDDRNAYHSLHEDDKKHNFHDTSSNNDHYTLHHEHEDLSPKLEDSNSNNSLLIDEQQFTAAAAATTAATAAATAVIPPVGGGGDGGKSVYQIITDNAGNETQMVSANGKRWMYCNICGKGFEEGASFEEHYETHFQKCNICLAVFTNSDVLNSHRKEAHGDTIEETKPIKTRLKRATLPIKDCHSNDSNSDDSGDDYADDRGEADEEEEEDDVKDGVKAEVPEKGASKRKIWSPKVCKECGKSYKTNYKLNEHMRKHTGEKPYKCDMCEKDFRSKIGLAQHAAKHTGKYDYSCPTCGKGFQCKSYLMVHQRVHSDVKPYPCTTCGRNFKTKQSLLDHTNRHLGVKPYMCDICGRGFITKGLCKAHQKIHTGLDNRKYSCKVCNKMFVSKSYLQTHLRIHTGEKPFICEVCGKGFLTKVDLRIHTTMHTGEKSYVCEMCGKAFARRDALRCHRRSHTGERPYSCDLCGQTFTQFTPMAIHKRLHTGERPYACEICGKTFVSRSTMMSHAKKHVK